MKTPAPPFILHSILMLFLLTAGLHLPAQEKSLPGNFVHDKMYNLRKASNAIILPDSIIVFVNTINLSSPYKTKYTYAHLSVYKVLLNKDLPVSDRRFFFNQIMNNHSTLWVPIHAHLRIVAEKMKI